MPCDRRLGSYSFVSSTGRRGAGAGRWFLVRLARESGHGSPDCAGFWHAR